MNWLTGLGVPTWPLFKSKPMTVGELRELISDVPDHLEVVCFAPNGDGFTPETSQSGEIEFEQLVDYDGNPVDMEPPPNILSLMHADAQKSEDEDYISFNYN